MTNITWQAHYATGETVTPESVPYAHLDRDRLQAFDLLQGSRLLVRVELREDGLGRRALIYRKRTLQRNDGTEGATFYLVGWQRVVLGQKVQAICYLFEDGRVLLGGQFRGDDELMDEIVPFEWEKDLV